MIQTMTRQQAILAVDKGLRVARTNRPFSGDMRERFMLAARLLADFGMDREEAPSLGEGAGLSPGPGGSESADAAPETGGGTPPPPQAQSTGAAKGKGKGKGK